MPDSRQLQTTESKQKTGGRPFGSLSSNRLTSVSQEKMKLQYGKLRIISEVVERPKGPLSRAHVWTQCVICKTKTLRDMTSVLRNQAGCRKCGRKQFRQRRCEYWLYCRCLAARSRCQDSANPRYHHYGGRGIEFRFASAVEMAQWIEKNLGLHKNLQIDRINNNGHYEAGNIRYSSRSQNVSHTTRGLNNIKANIFREKYPEIRYADATLRKLFSNGLTPEQIVERFYQPSNKPKGKYGTFSTADPDILLLAKDCSFTTA